MDLVTGPIRNYCALQARSEPIRSYSQTPLWTRRQAQFGSQLSTASFEWTSSMKLH